MIAVTSRLPAEQGGRPPIVLVHGAANSARVWTFWQDAVANAGFASHAVDLRGHGASAPYDLSRTSMDDYADDLCEVVARQDGAPILIGWSMGGLIAMMAAARLGDAVRAAIGFAPSTPAMRRDSTIAIRSGVFDASEYGIASADPDDQPAMPDLDREERSVALSSLCGESRFARDERASGVVIGELPCPLLIVTGTADAQWPRSRYDGLHLPAEHLSVEGASHWGLVLSRKVIADTLRRITGWLGA